jgi:PAS domain S-box-containing protein
VPDNQLPNPEFELDFEHDLVQDAPDGYDVVDRNGIILYINTNTKTKEGNSFVGTPIYDYFLPEYHQIVAEKLAEVFTTGENNQYELATEYWPGKREYYMTNLRPIKRNGEVVAVSLYIRNITELKTAQNDLLELNARLEQRVEERTRELQENIANR